MPRPRVSIYICSTYNIYVQQNEIVQMLEALLTNREFFVPLLLFFFHYFLVIYSWLYQFIGTIYYSDTNISYIVVMFHFFIFISYFLTVLFLICILSFKNKQKTKQKENLIFYIISLLSLFYFSLLLSVFLLFILTVSCVLSWFSHSACCSPLR